MSQPPHFQPVSSTPNPRAGPHGETYGLATGRTESAVNAHTGGWDITNTTRLIYVNGDFDPWRTASVSSAELRPGGALEPTEQVPVNIVPGGFHVSDMVTQNGEVNVGVQAAIEREVAQLVAWVGEWPGYAGRRRWRA